jgi:hypothetical protein
MARPVYIALVAELSTTIIDWLAFTPGAHALMVPSSAAKMKFRFLALKLEIRRRSVEHDSRSVCRGRLDLSERTVHSRRWESEP